MKPTKGDLEINLHNTMDARIWADEFNRVLVSKGEQPYDPGWLIGWFANAIMCGYDHAKKKDAETRAEAVKIVEAMEDGLLSCPDCKRCIFHREKQISKII